MKGKMKKNMKELKKGVKLLLFLWRLFVTLLLSSALIPLFLLNSTKQALYLWFILPSLLLYMGVIMVQPKLKRGFIKEYLQKFSTRLFLAIITLTSAYLFVLFSVPVWSAVLLVMAAVLYAVTIQKLFFLRVIGL